VLAIAVLNSQMRGTRLHLYPFVSGLAFYGIALLLDILEETIFYYYALATWASILLVAFFGREFYSGFELTGPY